MWFWFICMSSTTPLSPASQALGHGSERWCTFVELISSDVQPGYHCFGFASKHNPAGCPAWCRHTGRWTWGSSTWDLSCWLSVRYRWCLKIFTGDPSHSIHWFSKYFSKNRFKNSRATKMELTQKKGWPHGTIWVPKAASRQLGIFGSPLGMLNFST